jgi:protein-L-isoaspartate O-methyltransferase
MLDYLNEYPLADEILAAVYLKKREKFRAPKSAKAAYADMQAVAGSLGPGLKQAQMPAHLKTMLEQALQMQAKLNKMGA